MTHEATDDRGTKGGGVDEVANEAPVRDIEAAFGTKMGALTACAEIAGGRGGESGWVLQSHQACPGSVGACILTWVTVDPATVLLRQ